MKPCFGCANPDTCQAHGCAWEAVKARRAKSLEDAKTMQRSAIAVSDWLAGGCDVHDIPRPQIALLAAMVKEVADGVLKTHNAELKGGPQ